VEPSLRLLANPHLLFDLVERAEESMRAAMLTFASMPGCV